MLVTTKAVRRLFIAAGLAACAVSANAFALGIDPQIMINRAIGSPTLTIRYTGVSASLVELRINGASVGTRTVDASSRDGETNFTLNLGDLHDGDNQVEIRIFDRAGNLVAKDHTNISTAPAQEGPAYLSYPKTGSTVQGSVNVKLNLDRDLKDCYVSFFVDGSFKSMMNYPPFEYTWETEREPNGWHELEAWAIDDSSNTHKTGKVRVFVNNPHGDTRRFGTSLDLAPALNPGTLLPAATLSRPIRKSGLKSLRGKAFDLKPLPATTPNISSLAVLGSPAKVKPIKPTTDGIPMGMRIHQPSGKFKSAVAFHGKVMDLPKHDAMVVSVVNHKDSGLAVTSKHPDSLVAYVGNGKQAGKATSMVENALGLVDLTKGSRLPNLSSFYIALDSNFVDFHGVMPRVDDGVPMTPLRFLLEKKGGLVTWDNPSKTVFAKAEGNALSVHIGDAYALLNQSNVGLERPSYLDRGRAIVPLSFMEKALKVKIQYDKSSNHVLITSRKK